MPDQLTDDQRRKLFDDNQRLAHYTLSLMKLLPSQELTQTALIGLWKASQRYDPSRGVAFSTYACRAIWNTVSRHQDEERRERYRQMEQLVEVDPIDDRAQSPVTQAIASEEKQIIADAIGQLRPRQQQVVSLRMQGATFSEIGQTLGVSRQGAMLSRTSALKQLSKSPSIHRLSR